METSQKGIDLIKKFEGLKLKSYQCPAGIWTIGYGTTENVKKGMTITEEEAERLLREDLKRFEKTINSLVKVELNQEIFDALVCLVYNIGEGNFSRSTLLDRLNRKDFDGVVYEIVRWNKVGGKVVPGLTRRRAEEKKLFITGMVKMKD